jgi:hypothetical protein
MVDFKLMVVEIQINIIIDIILIALAFLINFIFFNIY